LLYRLLLIEEGEVVVVMVLRLGLLHRLPFLSELQVLLIIVVIVLEVEVVLLLGDVGRGRWRRRWRRLWGRWRRLASTEHRVGGDEATRHGEVEAERKNADGC
jgi:hypothetical protein